MKPGDLVRVSEKLGTNPRLWLVSCYEDDPERTANIFLSLSPGPSHVLLVISVIGNEACVLAPGGRLAYKGTEFFRQAESSGPSASR